MSKSKINSTWGRISDDYSKLVVPNRPSEDDLTSYGLSVNKVLKNKRKAKVMVMGSTPELRNMLYLYSVLNDAEVFCVDASSSMYDAMKVFMINADFKKEKYVEASWLETGFKEKTFDLVVGDEVICNVPSESHNKLFKEVSRVLKDDGIWVTRHNLYATRGGNSSIKEVLVDVARKVSCGEYDSQKAVNILFTRIFLIRDPRGSSTVSIGNHLKLIRNEIKGKLKKHKLLPVIKELSSLYKDNFFKICGDYKWHLLSEKESERELEEVFVIKEKLYSNDYVTAKCSPIYVLSKK